MAMKVSLAWLAGLIVAILLTTALIGLSVEFVESLVSPVLAYPAKAFQVMLCLLVMFLALAAMLQLINVGSLLLPDDEDDERELR